MNKFAIISVLMLLLTISTALAWGPRTHAAMLNKLCEEPTSWPNKDLCCNQYKDVCMAGMLETDRDVFHYFSDFKKYEVDHSWGTVELCFNKARDSGERAWCVGTALHLAMDSISHNEFIPDQTAEWTIFPEAVTHVFLESGIDTKYQDNRDEITTYLRPEILSKYCKGTDSIAYRSTGKVSDWECDALAGAVSKGGMYQSVFLVGPMVNGLYQGFISVSGLLPTLPYEPYETQALQMARQTLADNWPVQYNPTGYEALKLSNLGWQVVSTLMILALIVLIIVYGLRLVRKGRR